MNHKLLRSVSLTAVFALVFQLFTFSAYAFIPLVQPSISNLDFIDQAQSTYAANLGDPLATSFDYKHISIGSSLKIEVQHYDPLSSSYLTIKTDTFVFNNTSGTMDYEWDGLDPSINPVTNAKDGQYMIKVSGQNIDSNQNTTALGPITLAFTVKNFQLNQIPIAQGTVSNAAVEQSEYNNDMNIKLSYDYESKSEDLSISPKVYRTVNIFGGNPTKTLVKDFGTQTVATNSGSKTKTFTWDQVDGVQNGNLWVGEGTYTFEVTWHDADSATTTLNADFSISFPVIDVVTVSSTDYDPSSGPLTISGKVSKLAPNATLDLATYIMYGDLQNGQIMYVKNLTDVQNDDYSFTWDGTGFNPGVYLIVTIADLNGQGGGKSINPSATLFNLVNSQVVPADPSAISFSSLSVTPTPLDPSQDNAILSYNLNNGTANTVATVTIYDLSNNVISQWNSQHPSNGTNTITWNPSNSLDDGFYFFEVKGTDGNTTIPAYKTLFEVQKDTPSQDATLCGGFSDAKTADFSADDCAAIKYFKDHSVFTGTGDGRLDPYGLLQRDQVTKVLLEASGNYNSSTDYCTSVTRLKDMSPAQWSDNYVCRGMTFQVGASPMIVGYSSGEFTGYFKPANLVNRAEYTALVFRLFGIKGSSNYSDVKSGDWFEDYAKSAKYYNFFAGSSFGASKTVTRLDVIQTLWKIHQADASLL